MVRFDKAFPKTFSMRQEAGQRAKGCRRVTAFTYDTVSHSALQHAADDRVDELCTVSTSLTFGISMPMTLPVSFGVEAPVFSTASLTSARICCFEVLPSGIGMKHIDLGLRLGDEVSAGALLEL